MTDKQHHEQYHLTLEVLPESRPSAIRLRLLLKDMLRRLKIRCVRIAEIVPSSGDQPQGTGKED